MDYMVLAPEVGAETLLQELARAEKDVIRFLVSDPRFHRCDLLALLLSHSESIQLKDPFKAADLASRAVWLADAATTTLPVTSPSALFQAHLLAANAFRLVRYYNSAEDHLWRATPGRCVHEADDLDRAHLCRTLAMVRWERGQLDEALALLRRATNLFDSCRKMIDSAASSLLTVLLLDEMGSSSGELLGIATRTIGNPVVECCPPWLVARASLTLASSFPNAYARAAFTQGLHYLGLVADLDEQYRLFRLEGRTRARMGYPLEGGKILEAVRQEQIRFQSLVDLTLTSIDLLALRASHDQDPRIEEIEAPIQATSSELGSLSAAAIDRFVSLVAGDEEPWQAANAATSWFLVRTRFLEMGPAPLPFV